MEKLSVQSYIATVSFPNSIEEFAYIADNDCYFDTETVLDRVDDMEFTAPKWATKNDIVFFYHSKVSKAHIGKIRTEITKNKDKYASNYEKYMDYLDIASNIFNSIGGKIFAVGRVEGSPFYFETKEERKVHWASRVYAKIKDIVVLEYPIDFCKFNEDIKISMWTAITPVLGNDFEKLKQIVLRWNENIDYLENSKAVPIPLKDITEKNWIETTYDFRKNFCLEAQFRRYYIDYLLKILSDKKKVYKECVCYSDEKKTGYADYFVLINNKYIPVEVKLNINASQSLNKQMVKYCNANNIKLNKDKEISKNQIWNDKCIVIDVYRIGIYERKNDGILYLENLDNIKSFNDILKLKGKIKQYLTEVR